MNTTATLTDYEKQGTDFLQKTGVGLIVEFAENGKNFDTDKETRDNYKVTLKRGRHSYSFRFGQSIARSAKVKDKLSGREYTLSGKSAGQHSYRYLAPAKFPRRKGDFSSDFKFIEGTKPTAYDILCCLTKNDPGTFDDFCSDFGYDSDSRKAKKTYKAVRNEYLEVCRLFSESEREEMAEIQ